MMDHTIANMVSECVQLIEVLDHVGNHFPSLHGFTRSLQDNHALDWEGL